MGKDSSPFYKGVGREVQPATRPNALLLKEDLEDHSWITSPRKCGDYSSILSRTSSEKY